MNFGEPGRGHQGDWTLPIDEARPIFKAALDLGLFYFDCADVYGLGACEQVVDQLAEVSRVPQFRNCRSKFHGCNSEFRACMSVFRACTRNSAPPMKDSAVR